MGNIKKTAFIDVREDDQDFHLMTKVTATLYWNTADPSKKYTHWICTATGDIGRGKEPEEMRSWTYTPQNDQTGLVLFSIMPDDGSAGTTQFDIDVSGALQEQKIVVAQEFPFYVKMQGTGTIRAGGGRFANGTRIVYQVVQLG